MYEVVSLPPLLLPLLKAIVVVVPWLQAPARHSSHTFDCLASVFRVCWSLTLVVLLATPPTHPPMHIPRP